MWKAIHRLTSILIRPETGLGNRLFFFISQLTPLINVELLVKTSSNNDSILVYRNDEFYGPGWHLPGGIIRFKENINTRIYKTLFNELNISKSMINDIKVQNLFEIIDSKRDVRGHFVSILVLVEINKLTQFVSYEDDYIYQNGDVRLHSKAPEMLIKEHERYRIYLNNQINIPNVKVHSYVSKGKWT